jgi:hypothetical protein
MQIDSTENYIDLEAVMNLPSTPIDDLAKFTELASENSIPVTKEGRASINISGRNKLGGFVNGLKFNPGTFTVYNFFDPKAKKVLNENLQKVVLTMKEGEVAWVKLEPSFHQRAGFEEDIFFRLEIIKFEPIKKTFNELSYEEQIEQIAKQKLDADEHFKAGRVTEANQQYHSAFCCFKGIPRKIKKALTDAQKDAHKVLGLNLCRNFIRTLYKTKDYAMAKEVGKYVLNHLDDKDLKTKFLLLDVYKQSGDKHILIEEVNALSKEKLEEPFVSQLRKFQQLALKPPQSILHRAFKESLENNEKERQREKIFALIPDEHKKELVKFDGA